MDTYPHFGTSTDGMDRGLMALGVVIDMIRSVHESGQDLSTAEPENLVSLLDLVREEFKNRQSHPLRLPLRKRRRELGCRNEAVDLAVTG